MFTLYLWTVVAMASDRAYRQVEQDWRPAGEFTSEQRCKQAAAQLGLTDGQTNRGFRCLQK